MSDEVHYGTSIDNASMMVLDPEDPAEDWLRIYGAVFCDNGL